VLNLSMSLFVQKGHHLRYGFKKFICGPVEFSPRAPVHYLSIRWRPAYAPDRLVHEPTSRLSQGNRRAETKSPWSR
jgi:hypothetical protein